MCKNIKFLVFGIVFLLSGCADNPITGQQELMFFPEGQDVEIGKKYAPEIEKELGGRIKDNQLQQYIDGVGQKVAYMGHKPSWEYHFTALNHNMINAFALPGGYIFITKGLLRKLETEAQLAAVLAHETVHVVARDTMNAMSNDIGLSVLLTAAVSQENTQGAVAAAGLTRMIVNLQYSRKDEREADLGGLSYMAAAGYNPYGMVETMQILENQQNFEAVDFFSTHPSPANRVGYIGLQIEMKYDDLNLSKTITNRQDYKTNVLDRLPPDPPFELH